MTAAKATATAATAAAAKANDDDDDGSGNKSDGDGGGGGGGDSDKDDDDDDNDDNDGGGGGGGGEDDNDYVGNDGDNNRLACNDRIDRGCRGLPAPWGRTAVALLSPSSQAPSANANANVLAFIIYVP